jgi:5-methylcytosine-specific restriction endonuclease McrA
MVGCEERARHAQSSAVSSPNPLRWKNIWMVDEKGEECRVYVLRKRDSAEWQVLAANGDENAQICILAVGKFHRLMAEELSWCACCDVHFAPSDIPHAFVILIPIKRSPTDLTARAFAVCAECNKQEDDWLVDQSVRRDGLAPTTARPGEKIH